MVRQLIIALRITLVLLLLVSGIYPLVVWSLSQAIFQNQANGSLAQDSQGRVVGSRLLAQAFTRPEYFHPRPSAAGGGYDGTASGGTNLGPTSAKLIHEIRNLATAYRVENGLPAGALVPVDAVTRSASGLDPDISLANAQYQTARIAKARGKTPKEIQRMIQNHIRGRGLGFLGEPRVNVLELNLALDKMQHGS